VQMQYASPCALSPYFPTGFFGSFNEACVGRAYSPMGECYVTLVRVMWANTCFTPEGSHISI
jgi:hypothetical protein